MIGLDTSFLIDYFRRDPGARQLIEQEDAFCVSELVVFEFLCGNLSDSAENAFLAFVSQLESFPVTREAARLSAKLHRGAKRKGMAIGAADALIAGTLLAHGVKRVATRNAKHFKGTGIEPVAY